MVGALTTLDFLTSAVAIGGLIGSALTSFTAAEPVKEPEQVLV